MKRTYFELSPQVIFIVSVLFISLVATQSAISGTLTNSSNIGVISKIETVQKNDGVEVIIHGNSTMAYKVFQFDNPSRIALDIPDYQLQNVPGSISVDSGTVTRIVSREFRNEKQALTRIEILLACQDCKEHSIEEGQQSLSIFLPYTDEFRPQPTRDILSQVEATTPAKQQTFAVPNKKPASYIRIAQAQPSSVGTSEQLIGVEEDVSGELQTDYEGVPISLDLKDADIVDIFLTMSEITGYNILVDPAVSGKKINIRMTNVPWDQALDIILKHMELGKEYTGTKTEEYPRGNIIRIASVQKLKQEADQRRELIESRKIAEPLITKIFYLSYANAGVMQDKLQNVMSTRGQAIIDDRTNALIITDIQDNMIKIKNMISLLDVRTKQVLIASQIVTTKKDFTRDLGIQWGGRFIADATHGNTTGYRFPNNYAIDGTSNGGYAVNLPAGSPVLGMTLGNVLDTLQLNFLLSAGETEGLTKIISSPRVMTSDNVEAEIKTGTQIAYTIFSDRGLEAQFKDATISLKVTPHITNDNYIRMKIEAKKDSPDFSVNPPAINTNNAKTEVLVKDGDTIVIGGLNQTTTGWNEERLPLLHRIPFLGWLFRSKSTKNAYDDLLIFISPKVVHQEKSQIQAITFDQKMAPPDANN